MGLNAFYWYQIFALDSAVVEVQEIFSSHGGHLTNAMYQAILTCLKMAVGDCAKHECQGCRIDHPSQKYHDMCLWTSPREWIEDYRCHDPALEGLNIYDVMEDFDNRIWDYLYGDNWRHPMHFTTGINQKKIKTPIKLAVLQEKSKTLTNQISMCLDPHLN